jgi:glycosyltransferase involved in cell wall biosynthesis
MRLRLPSDVVVANIWARPPALLANGPVVLVLPAHDEAPRIAAVIDRLPATVCGRTTVCVVVDDGSSDGTGAIAMARGADVVRHETMRGLGAAVRTGFRRGIEIDASALAFCDADGEYDPAELERLVVPLAAGEAHYVVGSRFAGTIEHMRPHRRLGNRVLTALTRIVSRCTITDGQSGYRALSRAALDSAEIEHDYNYAQVLTLDLVGKGFGYYEVPITYRFRSSGRSFIRLVPYLRHVLPAMSRVVRAAAARRYPELSASAAARVHPGQTVPG